MPESIVADAAQALDLLTQLESGDFTDPDSLMRADGTLQNAMLGFGNKNGIEADVEAYNKVGTECRLSQSQQEDLFAEDALVERVCTFFPSKMARSGFTTDHKSDDKIQEWVESSNLMGLFEEASVLANIYDRGAGVVLGVDDGNDRPWSEPVDLKNIKSVKPLFVRGGHYLQPVWLGLDAPSHYILSIDGQSISDLATANGVASADKLPANFTTSIHPDRVLWFPGIWVPSNVERRRQGSPSLLSRFWKHYSRWEMGNKIALNLMARISIVHYQQKGWLKMLAQNDAKSTEEVRKRLEILKTMSTMGVLVSDMEENKVEIVSRSLAEVANILDRLERGMLAASGMSRIDLFGIAEGGGLSSDDLRDRMLNADKILTEQNRYWKAPLVKAIKYFLQAEKADTESLKVEFTSTLVYTRQEQINEIQAIAGFMVNFIGSAITADEMREVLNDSGLLKGKFPGKAPVPEAPPEGDFGGGQQF